MTGRYRTASGPEEFVRVASRRELPPGRVARIELDGRGLALVNLDGVFYALDNNCPHNGGPLAQGRVVEAGCLRCPWHGWTWDLRTGRAASPPVEYRVLTYLVRLEGDDVFVSRRPR